LKPQTENSLKKSFIAGVERVAAWSYLLDSINVFPIADGDTGRNLSISLTPLRSSSQPKEKVVHQLLLSARGNSGNIASRFFSVFYTAETVFDLAECAKVGSARAWQAVSDPIPGTMLSVFDVLTDALGRNGISPDRKTVDAILGRLEKSVHETYELLPKLKKAGVVDAGALGMYIFFEGFFRTLAGLPNDYRPVTETFKNRLQILPSFRENTESGYCVDFVVKAPDYSRDELQRITNAEGSVIIITEGDFYKVHLHTDDKEKVKAQMAEIGSMVNWEDDNLASQIQEFTHFNAGQTLHIMTDAAGSVTLQDASKYSLTLLNSYINVGEKCLPETYFHPAELYSAMRQGVKVSTAQASVYERHQFYASVLSRHEKVLYLCVGSVYTGNYQVAMQWKKEHDPQDRLRVIDTGAASGRLGTMVLSCTRYLTQTKDMEKTYEFAQKVVKSCEEYLFLDKLQYLAAGGRLSKTSAFFGDMLKMKPVISPQPQGVIKVGVVRNQKEQIKLALEKLGATLKKDSSALIMLEYSDNRDWVERTLKPILKERYPLADILLQPLSLTSGAHMGPGTWGVAFLPE
jgi:DegV family protein with EDD domain